MKKNAMLKIAAILMVAVLLTTCAISSTFAKYTTTGVAGTASARVAKWGVTINTDITDLFVDKYDLNSEDEVIGFELADVVAPGTSKSIPLDVSVQGTPEVAVAVTTDANVTLSNWEYKANAEAEAEFYCPLVFTITLNSVAKTIKMGDVIEGENVIDTQAEFETAVEDAIKAAKKDYPAGTNLKDQADFDLIIAWEWAFSAGNDVKDTYLGDQAANATAATVAFSITQTVTQIDTYPVPNQG